MKVIDSITFNIKTKIPYSEWPDIVHTFFEEFNLKYEKFFYYFEEYLRTDSRDEYGKSMRSGPCMRAIKDCSLFGEPQYPPTKENRIPEKRWLTNIGFDTGCKEADVLHLMNKIYKRYGFAETDLYYSNISFFGKDISCNNKTSSSQNQLDSSRIQLHRDCLAENYLSLDIDIINNGKILDASPYFEAMKRLLPKIRSERQIIVQFDEDEETRNNELMIGAEPLVEKCIDYLEDWNYFNFEQSYLMPKYSMAKTLKRISKEYGYHYQFVENYVYMIKKITPRGHIISLEAITGPSHCDVNYVLTFSGFEFSHELANFGHAPRSQEDLDHFVDGFMKVLSGFEKDALPELDAYYPETPEWYNRIKLY